jgi:hypothetical protein
MDIADLEDPSRRASRSAISRYCCCFLRWKVRFLFETINFLVLLNSFFGCIIAWMLMYQSSKTEAFTVLGLEGGSLILHFLSVWLEGSFHTCKQIAFHCIPLVPFLISIGLVCYYLKQGGVVSPCTSLKRRFEIPLICFLQCYLVEDRVFKFTGCEICNISGILEPCPNGTSLFDGLDNLDTVDKIKDKVLERTVQATYCSAERSFCFYDYGNGQVPPVNGLDSTNFPTEFLFTDMATSAPDQSPGEALPDNNNQNDGLGSAQPPVTPETPYPIKAPIAPTNIATASPIPGPTLNPTLEPTPMPLEEQPPDSSPENGEGGNDSFDMDEIGSDGFNPNDFSG